MANISVNYNKEVGKIKIMHAVNNGPLVTKRATRGNFEAYKALKIPYARNHDASFFNIYGLNHTVDVSFIFTDFDADVNDPASYDFAITDKYVKDTLDAGTEIFYRLGSKPEAFVKKYNTIPPKDFKKWAEICEHIIMHYNEGWADGFEYNLKYWEIWNEPDLKSSDACWGGTVEQFYDLYETTAKHLKGRFPHLKIGGPASAHHVKEDGWVDLFLAEMKKREVPMDFLSWHYYSNDPAAVAKNASLGREILDKHGYTETETIINEINYVRNWNDLNYSADQIRKIKGAAFYADVMMRCQHSPLDMLMYYDFGPSIWNPAFDLRTYYPIKGYHSIKMFSQLYQLGAECEHICDDDAVSVIAAKNENGYTGLMLCYFEEDDSVKEAKTVKVALGENATNVKLALVDKTRNGRSLPATLKNGTLEITLKPNSFAYVSARLC